MLDNSGYPVLSRLQKSLALLREGLEPTKERDLEVCKVQTRPAFWAVQQGSPFLIRMWDSPAFRGPEKKGFHHMDARKYGRDAPAGLTPLSCGSQKYR